MYRCARRRRRAQDPQTSWASGRGASPQNTHDSRRLDGGVVGGSTGRDADVVGPVVGWSEASGSQAGAGETAAVPSEQRGCAGEGE